MSDVMVEREGHVQIIKLNRPNARNSQSPEMVVALHEACIQARDNSDIRAVVMAATGNEAFCAGGDLKLMIPLLTGARKAESEADRRVLDMLRTEDQPLPIKSDIGKPIIAAVEGAALGGGLELLLACDIIIAGEGASFAAPEVQAGAYPSRLTFLLPQRLPYSVAIDLLMSGRRLNADEAYNFGLASQLVPKGDAFITAIKTAKQIATNAPLSVQAARRMALKSLQNGNKELEKSDRSEASKIYRSEDAREGPRAFAEKRKPEFKGR